ARILGEVTLNAAKHAPGTPLQVTLSREEELVRLRARNPLPAAPAPTLSAGHGLLGVQERARLLGGDARHGAADGAFEVEAWVPWGTVRRPPPTLPMPTAPRCGCCWWTTRR